MTDDHKQHLFELARERASLRAALKESLDAFTDDEISSITAHIRCLIAAREKDTP